TAYNRHSRLEFRRVLIQSLQLLRRRHSAPDDRRLAALSQVRLYQAGHAGDVLRRPLAHLDLRVAPRDAGHPVARLPLSGMAQPEIGSASCGEGVAISRRAV